MANQIDIKEIAQKIQPQAESLLFDWYPSGKIKSGEFCIGDISGTPGESLKVNLSTGKWKDFAAGVAGGDLVALYAAKHNINNLEAARALAQVTHVTASTPARRTPTIIKPPPDLTPPMKHKTLGDVTSLYTYRDADGAPLFYVARYDTSEGKEFRPICYTTENRWTNTGYPAPRPIYGLELLNGPEARPHVLIVEGEKSADAARKFITSTYAVISWPNGAQAIDKTDWSPLANRNILIWPDHDKPGREAAAKLARLLLPTAQSVKVINTSTLELPDGWDAADSGFKSYAEFKDWAKPLVKTVTADIPASPADIPAPPVEIMPPLPELPDLPDAPPQHHTTNILITDEDTAEQLTTKITANESKNITRCGLQTTARGLPIENLLNVGKVLAVDFSGQFWFDEFYRSFYTNINGKPEPLHDSHILNLQMLLQSRYSMRKVSRSMITDGITSFAYGDRRNAAKDYFLSLKWDGAPRIEDFFANACGADDTPLNQAISRYFFSSIMARFFGTELDPIYGNKVDSMVVIEGDQGIAKGMFLKTLVGRDWHYEVSKDIKHIDFFQDMRGKLIAEVAELASFDRQGVKAIRRVITCQTDRLRVSYGKESQDFDRVCIFVGTTNEDEYLEDDKGNRRFLPIKAKTVDLEYVKNNREQLFAEALVYYRENVKTWWVMPKDDLNEAHSHRMVTTVANEYKTKIEDWINKKQYCQEIQIADVWVDCLKGDITRLTHKNRTDVGAALRALGWVYKNVYDKESKTISKRWVRGDS